MQSSYSRTSLVFDESYRDCSLDTLCTRGEFGKGDILVADIEELETMDASEIHARRLYAREVLAPENGEKLYSRGTQSERKYVCSVVAIKSG